MSLLVEVSWIFSSCGGNLEYILELRRRWPFKTHVCSATSRLLSSYEENHRNLQEAWQGNTDASRRDGGDGGSLSSCTMILGFLSVLKKSQGSSPFEALNSACLSRCQRDVRPPDQMRRGPRTFSGLLRGFTNPFIL